MPKFTPEEFTTDVRNEENDHKTHSAAALSVVYKWIEAKATDAQLARALRVHRYGEHTLGERHPTFRWLRRLIAGRDLPHHGVRTGDIGGWVDAVERVSGGGWVADEAIVFGDTVVTDHARVGDRARILDQAQVRDHARVGGDAVVAGNTIVEGNAVVDGMTAVYGSGIVSGDTIISAAFGEK